MKKILVMVFSLCLLFGLTSAGFSSGQDQGENLNFTVVFQSEQLPGNAEEMVENMEGEVVCRIPEIGVLQVEAPSSFALDALEQNDIKVATPSMVVEMPELENIRVEAGDLEAEDAPEETSLPPLWDYQWDIQRMTNDGASYDLSTGSPEVVVGVIDTGIDLFHPDLAENLVGGKNYVPAGGLYDVDESETGEPGDIQDRNGHGSHVIGSIAADGHMMGIASDVGIKAYRVFAAEGGAYRTWILDAMTDAVEDGVDVINMSLGGTDIRGQIWYTDPETGEEKRLGNDVADSVAYTRAVQYAQQNDTLVVSSAGNDALNAGNRREVTDFMNEMYSDQGYRFVGAGFFNPAAIPNVVNVSATGPEDKLSLYSNYGAGFIDVAAPGGDYRIMMETDEDKYMEEELYTKEFCFSAVPIVEYEEDEDGLITDYEYLAPGYGWYVGTSMAAPKVSATAALIMSENEDLSPQQVKVRLQQTAENIGRGGNDKRFGHGLVNAYHALSR